ncbi:MAG: amidohydrolase family protein, partial [Planctomycetota bacterium]
MLIVGGKVQQIGKRLRLPAGLEEIDELDARGKWVMPGVIDSQVHFCEPGLEDKENLETGSIAAVCGGVTSFCEMPNTKPSTTSPAMLSDKLARAVNRSAADYAFFLGASRDNAEYLADWEQLVGCAGVKIFMGSSTGDLLVEDDQTLERVLRSGRRRCAVHSEDQARLDENYRRFAGQSDVRLHPEA